MSNKDEEEKWQTINQNNRSLEFKVWFEEIKQALKSQENNLPNKNQKE
jgi:hypothetical protein